MWLGEQVTERGIGNGISLIIFSGIIVRIPSGLGQLADLIRTDQFTILEAILLFVLVGIVLGAVVFVERSQRRIPIQHARRVVGRRVTQGGMSYFPLRVNTAGVIPPIFASSLLMFPMTIRQFTDSPEIQSFIDDFMNPGSFTYNMVFVALIMFFCFFYVSIIFNPMDQADNMKKYGGFIPGIRPGKKTAEHIDRILTRLTFGGAIYLASISLLPVLLTSGFQVASLPLVGDFLDKWIPSFITQGLNVKFFFGGTSLLIVVGVAMDTVQQIESQLIMRHYDGFLKGTRMKSRRG